MSTSHVLYHSIDSALSKFTRGAHETDFHRHAFVSGAVQEIAPVLPYLEVLRLSKYIDMQHDEFLLLSTHCPNLRVLEAYWGGVDFGNLASRKDSKRRFSLPNLEVLSLEHYACSDQTPCSDAEKATPKHSSSCKNCDAMQQDLCNRVDVSTITDYVQRSMPKLRTVRRLSEASKPTCYNQSRRELPCNLAWCLEKRLKLDESYDGALIGDEALESSYIRHTRGSRTPASP